MSDIISSLSEPLEMTFTIKDADMERLREMLCDINVNECPWFEVFDKHGNQAKYYREPQWIQCSETIDIPDHEILACDKYGEMMFGYLAYEDEQWLCASDGCMMYDPIAWREKPEPYKEDE